MQRDVQQESRAIARKPRDVPCFCLQNDSSIVIYIECECICETVNT